MLTTTGLLTAIVLGVVLAIAYALRYVVIMERRIANIELHIEKLTKAILREEKTIRSSIKRR